MPNRFQVDELIGEYRVTHFLGEGGMGEVYLGVHQKLERPAAIKILGAGASDPSFKTRFFNEARLQASLHHPNIAALYDFQEQGDELLIFMEYIDGESLDDLITRRAFSPAESLGVFASVCEAVAYIHQNGIVHRDIKSQNIKLTGAGTVKLLDFGIAKGAESHGLTQTGGIIGTPYYLSPEQLEGKPATPHTDIWALGVLLYEMLTGELPFRGDTLSSLVLRITLAHFKAPEEINPGIPRDVANIVKKCLKKVEGDRYKSVDELIRAIRATEAKQQTQTAEPYSTFGFIRARPPEADDETIVQRVDDIEKGENTSFWAAHRTVIMIVAGPAFLCLAIAAVFGIFVWSRSGTSATARTEIANANASPSAGIKAGTQHIRVDIDEGKAEVLRNGQVVGTTPLEMDLAVGENPQLTLRRQGFEDKLVQLEVGSGKRVFTFSLRPKN